MYTVLYSSRDSLLRCLHNPNAIILKASHPGLACCFADLQCTYLSQKLVTNLQTAYNYMYIHVHMYVYIQCMYNVHV